MRLLVALVFAAALVGGGAIADVRSGPAAVEASAGPAGAVREAADAREPLRETVRRAIAAYFGVSVEEVNDRTDLVADLHADPMDVLDVVSMLCREQGVEVPRRDDLTTVAAIVEYLWSAPVVPPAITQRGSRSGEAPAGGGGDAVTAVTLMYATDRRPSGETSPDHFFGGERQPGGTLNLGLCELTIPLIGPRRGAAALGALDSVEWIEDPAKHVVLNTVRPLERSAFFAELRRRGGAGATNTIIFVHGYNVSFARAARRTAQVAYDLDFQGVPILFSWPSAAKLTAYFSDRENVEWSAAHLEQFIGDIIAQGQGEHLHLLAHSMGNQAVIRALHAMALRRGPGLPPLFDNVILAAPDFDAQAFVDQIAPRVASLSRRWTIYASDKDRALDVAAKLSAVRRLGLPLPVARGIETVDASGIDVAPWSVPEFHGYFASKQRVIQDLTQVLRGVPPEARRLMRRLKDELPYWILQPQ